MTHPLTRRLQAALRNRDIGALAGDVPRVPGTEERKCLPDEPCLMASEYLLETSRFKRRETTIDVYLSDVGVRTIDVECELPDVGWGKDTWYLPLAFFAKNKVAPNLEVTHCDGAIIPIPTKTQNHAITSEALEELFVSGKLPRPRSEELRALVDEVITRPPFEASICRRAFEIEEKNDPNEGPNELMRLLRQLEENFVLWVPVEGEPRTEHLLRIARQEIRFPDAIIAQRLSSGMREIETAVGEWWAFGPLQYGKFAPRRRAILERLPKGLALRPIEASAYDPEAGRSISTHLRVQAPPGFTVRNVRAAALFPASPSGYRQIKEMDPRDSDTVIQGWDQDLSHVHLSRERNPQLYVLTTLTPRSGLITLWMLATTLTAIILWTLHHQSRYGPLPLPGPDADSQLLTAVADAAGRGDQQLAISVEKRQIAAAVLLIAPAIAAAWAVLTEEGGKLLRSFLAGARLLLLISAGVSIAAALALAGILPSRVSGYTAMEIYAGIAYLVAAPMFGAWLLSSRPVWDVFRWFLKHPLDNLVWIAWGGSVAMLAGLVAATPPRISGGVALLIGFMLALIAANSVAEPLRKDSKRRGLYRTVAGFGAMFIIVLAGSLLGFYADLLPHHWARVGLAIVGLAVMAGAELVVGLAPVTQEFSPERS